MCLTEQQMTCGHLKTKLPLSSEFGGISGAVGLVCLFSFHSNKTGCLHGQEDVLSFPCFWSHGLVRQDLLVLRLK